MSVHQLYKAGQLWRCESSSFYSASYHYICPLLYSLQQSQPSGRIAKNVPGSPTSFAPKTQFLPTVFPGRKSINTRESREGRFVADETEINYQSNAPQRRILTGRILILHSSKIQGRIVTMREQTTVLMTLSSCTLSTNNTLYRHIVPQLLAVE